jgi:hypothetical protein
MKCPKWHKQWICDDDRLQSDGHAQDKEAERTKTDRDSCWALLCLGLAMFIGLVIVGCFALQTSSTARGLGVLTTAIITAGASLMVGGTVGFIFGVPRTRSGERSSNTAAVQGGEGNEGEGPAPSANGSQPAASVEGNTNLEEISDWLTKMLVGVGLTQLYKVPDQLKLLASYVADGLRGPDRSAPLILVSPEAFALGLIVYFSFVGFLFGYLWTRFVLTGSLTRDALGRLRGQLTRQTDAIVQQLVQDDTAWKLVWRTLHPSEDEPPVPPAELDQAIAKASRVMKSRIFYEAARVRRETWRREKAQMERTIPIFAALCHDDKKDRYHANHGQLGFALKDKTRPDYEEAEKQLTKAIEIRDQVSPGRGWPYYELNRAICRIYLSRPVSGSAVPTSAAP